MSLSPQPAEDHGPLGLLAGSGDFPLRIIKAAQATGRAVFVVALDGQVDPAVFADVPHVVCKMGAAGSILAAFRAHGVRQVTLCGRVARPALSSMGLDATGVKLVAKMGTAFLLGDDGLLRAVVKVMESEGLEVLPQNAILQALLPGFGCLTQARPDAAAEADIARGVAVVRALGGVDVGQGAVVQQGLVLAVEAIEGTDAMLARCGPLRREGPGGVLVKLVKPGQDRRVDLPTVGPLTVSGAVAAGLRGIAMEGFGTILVDREATVAAADAAGLFLIAIRPSDYQARETAP